MVKSTNGSSWFGILGVPLGNDPFHEMILGILTTNPNNQITVGWQNKLAIGPFKDGKKITWFFTENKTTSIP